MTVIASDRCIKNGAAEVLQCAWEKGATIFYLNINVKIKVDS